MLLGHAEHLLGCKALSIPNIFNSAEFLIYHPIKDKPILITEYEKPLSEICHFPVGHRFDLKVEIYDETIKYYKAKLISYYRYKKPDKLKLIVSKGGYENNQYVVFYLESGTFYFLNTIQDLENELAYYNKKSHRYFIEYWIPNETNA